MKSPAPSIEEVIVQYRDEYLTARNLVPLTRINYLSDLKQVHRYLTERLGLVHVDQVLPRHLDGFLVTLDERGLRGSSRRRLHWVALVTEAGRSDTRQWRIEPQNMCDDSADRIE